MTTITAKTDSKGRVTLGKGFETSLVIIKKVGAGLLEIIKAEAVPSPEVWLYRNKEAFESVMRGLEQTGKGEFAEPPDLSADSALADRMKG